MPTLANTPMPKAGSLRRGARVAQYNGTSMGKSTTISKVSSRGLALPPQRFSWLGRVARGKRANGMKFQVSNIEITLNNQVYSVAFAWPFTWMEQPNPHPQHTTHALTQSWSTQVSPRGWRPPTWKCCVQSGYRSWESNGPRHAPHARAPRPRRPRPPGGDGGVTGGVGATGAQLGVAGEKGCRSQETQGGKTLSNINCLDVHPNQTASDKLCQRIFIHFSWLSCPPTALATVSAQTSQCLRPAHPAVTGFTRPSTARPPPGQCLDRGRHGPALLRAVPPDEAAEAAEQHRRGHRRRQRGHRQPRASGGALSAEEKAKRGKCAWHSSGGNRGQGSRE